MAVAVASSLVLRPRTASPKVTKWRKWKTPRFQPPSGVTIDCKSLADSVALAAFARQVARGLVEPLGHVAEDFARAPVVGGLREAAAALGLLVQRLALLIGD